LDREPQVSANPKLWTWDGTKGFLEHENVQRRIKILKEFVFPFFIPQIHMDDWCGNTNPANQNNRKHGREKG